MSKYPPQSPEGVALELMHKIFESEAATLTREDILSTYAQCLMVVKGGDAPSATKRRSVAPMGDELEASKPC